MVKKMWLVYFASNNIATTMQWRRLLFCVGRPKSCFRSLSFCSGRPMRWYWLPETLVRTVQRFSLAAWRYYSQWMALRDDESVFLWYNNNNNNHFISANIFEDQAQWQITLHLGTYAYILRGTSMTCFPPTFPQLSHYVAYEKCHPV